MRLVSLLFVLLSVAGLASASEIRVWGPATTCPEVLTVPAGLNDATQIAAGLHHVIALKADGTVVAWGKNDLGQLNVPAGLTGVVKIQAGGESSMAIRGDGTFVMWGGNDSHQTDIPVGLNLISDGAVSFFDTVAVLPNGSLRQWGDFTSGVLPAVNSAQEAGLEAGLGLARLADHSVVMWASAFQLTGRVAAFTPPSGLQANKLIGPQYEKAMAITSSGALTVWGFDQLLVAATPVSVLSNDVTDAAIGASHILAIKGTGAMVSWTSISTDAVKLAIPVGWSGPSHITCGKQFSAALWTLTAPNGSAPSDIQLTPPTATVGTVSGSTVGTLTVTDGDPGDRHLFILVAGSGDSDNGTFSINGNDLITNQVIRESNTGLSIRVKTIDSGGLSMEKSIHITTSNIISEPTVVGKENNGESGGCGLGAAGLAILATLFISRMRIKS